MSSLKESEKVYLENILDMGGGYVLNFTDATFEDFFRDHGVDIHGGKYQTIGTSKAKKLRSFWEQESDELVGRVLSDLLGVYEANCDVRAREPNKALLAKSRGIVARLNGKAPSNEPHTVEDFLDQDFVIPHVQDLPVAFAVAEIIRDRLDEAQLCLSRGAYLSVIFLCGSVLEAVLLGVAEKNPEPFNRSPASPKQDGKVRRFQDWSLADLINVASNINVLQPDVKTFSHGLRDFRNYIHPYQQMASGFKPDEHTAKICFQVLKAALASVAGDRE